VLLRRQLGQRNRQGLPLLLADDLVLRRWGSRGVDQSVRVPAPAVLVAAQRPHEVASGDHRVRRPGPPVETSARAQDSGERLLHQVVDGFGIPNAGGDHSPYEGAQLDETGVVRLVSLLSAHTLSRRQAIQQRQRAQALSGDERNPWPGGAFL
jgi:hypothetical protein